DGAFIKLAQDLGFDGHDEEGAFNAIVEALTALGGGDPVPLLTDVLLYHVSPGAKYTRQIRRSDVIETLLDGGTIVPAGFTLLDAEPELVNPRIRWRSNIKASNGVIHTLNRVLIPADLPNTDPEVGTITDIVAASGGGFDRNRRDFDLLFNAVSTAGLAGALADTTADYTVLAPNDAAFIRLARDLGYRGWREQGAFDFIVGALTELGGGDPIPLLTDILLYHVSPGSQVLKDVVLTDSIETLLSGAVITPDGFTLEDGAPSLRDPKLKVSGGDIRASNGLIHTITRVLIPVDVGG
nr:fasciclin domain-containing protein [Acidiferrobacterales bacterium]